MRQKSTNHTMVVLVFFAFIISIITIIIGLRQNKSSNNPLTEEKALEEQGGEDLTEYFNDYFSQKENNKNPTSNNSNETATCVIEGQEVKDNAVASGIICIPEEID